VTIHSEHPFLPPRDDRDAVRRMRGRLPAPVTVWATGTGKERLGLTVSSLLVADGEPSRVLGLVDEDSDLATGMGDTWAISVLTTDHRFLADAFAGTAPAPGGPFTLGEWTQTEWGPVLDGAAGWMGVRRTQEPSRHVGWALLLEGVVEHLELTEADALVHVRGRYPR